MRGDPTLLELAEAGLQGSAVLKAAALIGTPPAKWARNCHGVSTALAPLVGGVVRRGYFHGELGADALFRSNMQQHSWIELPDGRVLDPTRFAFVGGKPELWLGPADEYDIGGCRMFAHAVGLPPSPYESESDPVLLELGSVDYVVDLLGDVFDSSVDSDDDPEELEEEEDRWVEVSREQAMWLANLPVLDGEGPRQLDRFFAAEVYETLVRAGFKALIPIDRLVWILPEEEVAP